MSDTTEYAEKLAKLLPLAKRAFGSRTNNTPAHHASREYTQLATEYYENGGSLVALAAELGVSYAGLRRRVMTASLPALPPRARTRMSQELVDEAVERVRTAKAQGPEEYHNALAAEYANGVSLAKIAKGLGISSSQPLYFGVQRALLRDGE
jgi:transposase-like protein